MSRFTTGLRIVIHAYQDTDMHSVLFLKLKVWIITGSSSYSLHSLTMKRKPWLEDAKLVALVGKCFLQIPCKFLANSLQILTKDQMNLCKSIFND